MLKHNWTYKKVKEVCDKASSNIVLNKIEDNTGDYPLFGASGFVKGIDFFHRDEPYIGIVKDGSGVGRVDVYPAKSSLVGTMQYILPKKDCSLKYLCYALQGLELSKFVNGAAIPHIYFRDYGECSIPIPPIETQSRIVSELDLLQSIIDKQKAQLKELDNLAQAVFYDMFGDPVENEKGWETIYLKKEIKIISGFAFRSDKFSDDGIPLLRIGNINTGKLKTEQIVFYPEDKKLDRYKVYPNDLVISLTGTAGKDDYGNVCVLDNTYPEYYLNQRNAKLEPSSSLNTIFLQFIFKDVSIKKKLTGINRGIRQGNISNKDIENLLVPVPPLSLQQSFAAKIESIEKQKAAIVKSIEETQKLFDYTMDKYFG